MSAYTNHDVMVAMAALHKPERIVRATLDAIAPGIESRALRAAHDAALRQATTPDSPLDVRIIATNTAAWLRGFIDGYADGYADEIERGQ